MNTDTSLAAEALAALAPVQANVDNERAIASKKPEYKGKLGKDMGRTIDPASGINGSIYPGRRK